MTTTDTKCEHHNFAAHVDVTRLEDTGRFTADVRIACADCETPMRFIGLPMGLDLNGAAVNASGQEARLAIAPAGEVVPPISGAQGFTARRQGDPGDVDAAKFHEVMSLLRRMEMPHGTCEPPERNACTACAAKRRLDEIRAAWKGCPLRLQGVPETTAQDVVDALDRTLPREEQLCPRRGEGVASAAFPPPDYWDVDRWFKDPAMAKVKHDAEDAKLSEESRSRHHRGAHNDLWLFDGPVPRTCSYCGGIHPGDAVRLIEAGWELEDTGKGYKYYMQPPGYGKYMRAVIAARGDVTQMPKTTIWHPTPPVKLYTMHLTVGKLDRINAAIAKREKEGGGSHDPG